MILLVSGFVTFLGFLFAGVLALAFTAFLDKSLGKERALLLFVLLLLVFTAWRCSPEPVGDKNARPKPERKAPGDRLNISGVPYARPDLRRGPDARNPFQKHSDTRSLEPVVLALPPWLPLPFELPPTVPGPAPGARRLLMGDLPTLQVGDGSAIPEIPPPVFADYQPVPEDLYDWIVSSGRRTYVYIRAIRDGGKLYEEGDDGFLERLLILAGRAPGWEGMQVTYALVGGEDTAAKYLEPTGVLKKRREGVSTAPSDQFDRWYPRRAVEIMYRETLKAHGLKWDPSGSSDIASLRAAAARLGEVGSTGKESKAGWRRAAELLEIALAEARKTAGPAIRAEILEELVAAYVELRDEQAVLRALSEYARTSASRPEPWLWLGRFHLRSLGVPGEALAYFEAATQRSAGNAKAWIGKGDALSALGRYPKALEAYREAGRDMNAKIAQAEALLRLGRLSDAEFALAGALSVKEGDAISPRARIAYGAVKYTAGELAEAKDAFAAAAAATAAEAGPAALEYRAQACYNLGLACWRMGEADAALAAFDACEKALNYGSSPSRFADETVSPAFGRALVSLAAGNEAGFRTAMQEAREEAPRVSYHEVLTGMMASRSGDDAAAVRAFERAMRLVLVYPELDGWLSKTRLKLGQLALAARTPIKEAVHDFEAAVAFATRASSTEAANDPKAFAALIRESWILLSAEQMTARNRFDAAKDVTNKVLAKIDREQPAALSIRGYCNYRLAKFGLAAVRANVDNAYDPCIRDWQLVLNKVAPGSENPWMPWRDYSADALSYVKHWLNLEVKLVSLDEQTMAQEWEKDESSGVRAVIEDGVVKLDDDASQDGSLDNPIFVMKSKVLFKVGTFEEVRLKVRIPMRDTSGDAQNTITFGVQAQRTSRRGGTRSRYSGLGIFYDRGKVAVRFGGGQEEAWKDGMIHRIDPEMEWPTGNWVEIRMVRTDDREGRMQIWLDADPDDGVEGELIAEDTVSGFKGTTKTPAELWIGGFSPQAQRYFVEIKDIRVVRRK